jgi:hypothetical protein
MLLLKIVAFLLGLSIVGWTLFSAARSIVLPRGMPDNLTRTVFILTWQIFRLRLRFASTYRQQDRIAAFFAPIALLILLPVWYSLVLVGYTGIYWALGISPLSEALVLSGSSMLTLGFKTSEILGVNLIIFSQATIGLLLVALLIAYLPTMYAAFSRREEAINLLEVRAGNPPSAVEMIARFNRIHGLDHLSEVWPRWETWFANLEESHTSLPALVFFRSARPEHSWVTASGAVLDCAALTLSSVDIPSDAGAALCLRAGFLALRRICDYLDLSYHADPHFPLQSISIKRDEFDAAIQELELVGVPIKSDREQAWLDFAGWRVNYDDTLLVLAGITLPPKAPWSSDRAHTFNPQIFPWGGNKGRH